LLSFDFHSIQVISLVIKEPSNYLKHSNQTQLSLHSISGVTELFISFSLNTGNELGNEGAIQLSEALKSNSSLTSLDLSSNRLCSFHLLTDYAGNVIHSRAARKLFKALKSNASLASPDLSGNKPDVRFILTLYRKSQDCY
jgi:hypothetical protein